MNDRNVRLLSAALIVLLGAACGEPADEEGPIRIGVLYPATGVGQVFGSPALLGHEMMIAEINAAGGLLGRQVVSVHGDTRSEPAEATVQARELVSREGVQFLLGGISSSEGQAISEVARQEQVIYIATVPKTTEMTSEENFHPYLFRTAANSNTEGKSAAIIADRLGFERICTILMDYSYGYSLDEAPPRGRDRLSGVAARRHDGLHDLHHEHPERRLRRSLQRDLGNAVSTVREAGADVRVLRSGTVRERGRDRLSGDRRRTG
jgi:hypothetical protein